MGTVNFQGRAITRSSRSGPLFFAMNITHVADGMRIPELFIRRAINRSRLFIVVERFCRVREVALNLPQCGERAGQEKLICVFTAEPHSLLQMQAGVGRTTLSTSLPGLIEKSLNFV